MPILFAAGSNQRAAPASGILSRFANLPGCTIMAWVNLTNFATQTTQFVLDVDRNGSTSSPRITLATNNSSGVYTFRSHSRRLDADSITILDTLTNPVNGTWYHVAVVANWSGGIFEIYLNGVRNNYATMAGWTGNCSNTNAGGIMIAGQGNSSTTTDLDGSIRNLKVFNLALTAAGIMSDYTKQGAGTGFSGMFAKWKMNGTPAAVPASVIDCVGGYAATPANNPVYAAGWTKRRRAA